MPDISNHPLSTSPIPGFYFAVGFTFHNIPFVEDLGNPIANIAATAANFAVDTAASILSSPTDFRFSRVSGIGFNLNTTRIGTGGGDEENNEVPGVVNYQKLKLERALSPNSRLSSWADQWKNEVFKINCNGVAEQTSNRQKASVLVMLLSSVDVPFMGWVFEEAWPTSYGISEFDAMKSDYVKETIELTYKRYTTLDLREIINSVSTGRGITI